MKHQDQELVRDEEDTDLSERAGEMYGGKIKTGIELATPALAGYAATRSELPLPLRIGLGLVAATGAPKLLAWGKAWLRKD